MGMCKSRSTAPEAATKATKFEPMPDKALRKSEANKVARGPGQPAASPATQSWRALLQEQPLNPDARPFLPEQTWSPGASLAPPLDPANVASATSGPKAADDEPEWMQYLAKKAHAASMTPCAGGPKSSHLEVKRGATSALARDPKKVPTRSEVAACAGGDEGSRGGTGMVIQTDAYLKLLKDGTSKKKKAAIISTAKRTANKTVASFGKPGLIVDMCRTEQADMSVPITTSSLVQKWSSAMGKATGSNAGPDEDVMQRTTQDDIWIANAFCDLDPSDPGYFSETDSANLKATASFHRFGRQPRLATRSYVMQDLSFVLDQTVGMLLNRLQRFTDYQKTYVVGLKEVVRRVKQCRVECLVVAPDIEEDATSGGLDDRMRELLASAYQNRTPVIFALSRARLGTALGKSLQISVLGVLDARGAKGLLARSVQLAGEGRQAWLGRLRV